MLPDCFGVPDQMFGMGPDDFYGLIGRIAFVATLLEDRLLGLLWALDDEPQATHAGLAATRPAQVGPLDALAPQTHDGRAGASLAGAVSPRVHERPLGRREGMSAVWCTVVP